MTGDRPSGAPEQVTESTTSLVALYRRPRAQPLATFVASLILVTLGYQAYITAQDVAWWVGVLVLAAGYLAYRIARVGWQVESGYIEAELAAARPEDLPTRERSDDSAAASK